MVGVAGDERAAQLLRTYERIVRSKVPRATLDAGRIADAFHIVFSSPSQAIKTAVEIADAFKRHNARHVDLPITVAFGIDAGQTIRQGSHWVGSAPVLAARLCHRALPGQVLMSDSMFALLRASKPAHVSDLGAWRARGGQITHVYEVRPPDDPAESVSSDRFLAALLFTDIVESTANAVKAGDRGWRALVERHNAAVREELKTHRGTEIDTAGDGFYASFDAPSQAIECALSARDRAGAFGVDIRAGVHVGECEIVGGKIGGLAVTVAARVMACGGAGDVLVSQTVKDMLIGTRLSFVERGRAALKGVPDAVTLWAVERESARSE